MLNHKTKIKISVIGLIVIGLTGLITYIQYPAKTTFQSTNPIVLAAKEQIGLVTKYDSGYYAGGYPPEDRGACSDVIRQTFDNFDYDIKERIDNDMKINPQNYKNDYDANINFRRVLNIKSYLENNETILPIEMNNDTIGTWQAGDIVTFEKIPGGLWHIAIISDRKNKDGIPYIIHNHGRGVVENDLLLRWPADISGHYRIDLGE